MELTTLRYFRAIAAAGHMTRAAESLGVTQPALSSMLRKLEDEVGAELLHRTGRGVELTEAGRLFLQHAEESLRQAGQARTAVRELMGLERGSIRLGGGATAITYLVPRVVSKFRRERPGVRFYVREAGSRAVAQSILAGELDLGIVTLPLDVPGGVDLLVTPWVEDELRMIVPPKSSARRSKSFRWKDIRGESVVAFEAGSAVREVIDRAAAGAGVALNVVMELRSIETIKRMVDAGIGVGFVSRFALKTGEGLACRDGKLARRMAIVRRRDRIPSPAVREFEQALMRSTRAQL
ncbi:MAG TPA: LysR substrate-binding domain-containing protein [Phycisphaerales bacterium]|nr:LysR substrate-binding domain-containing protein [Phycisphaerales bacterium]